MRSAFLARRRGSAAPIVAIIAVLSTLGAVAAFVAHRNNEARAARYANDPSCRVPIAAPAPTGLCTVEQASIAARYVRLSRGSHYYRLVVRTPDGTIDSIEVKGAGRRAIWTALPAGAALTAQRFTDDGASKRHVTVVRIGAQEAQTEWNPAWQTLNTTVGVWFLGVMAFSSIIALVWMRARSAARRY